MSSLSAFNWLQSSLGIDITGEWSGLVNLNVGGVTFSCQRKTFKAAADSSVLCKMALTTDRNVPRSEDGSIIIDRDPETFRHVLNFLRSNQRLILPDNFEEWDLLLEDARVYELPKLSEAIRGHPRYQQRCFLQALPQGVMLRWVEASSSAKTNSSQAAAAPVDKKDQHNQNQQQHIEIYPPLHLFAVDSASNNLLFQDRVISTIDEAVAILITTYSMKVDVWHRDANNQNNGKFSHTVFLTRRS